MNLHVVLGPKMALVIGNLKIGIFSINLYLLNRLKLAINLNFLSNLFLCSYINSRTTGHSYSTCSIDPKTCPDGYCDSLERLNPEGLCPQDCMSKGKVN